MTGEALPYRLAVAVAIGLLIGLERGWRQRDEAEGARTAGLRTYTLAAFLGGLSAAIGQETSPLVLGLSLLAFTGGFAAFAWLEARADQNFSVTGVVAAMLSFMLGAYAILGDLRVAIAAGVLVTLILALKQPLHTWLRHLTWIEIRAALILLAMTFLALPLLPDRTIDPWDAINPAKIWLLAIIIAGVSFVGYVAVRVTQSRAGIAMAALAGGLASSTATTLTLARLSREHPAASPLLAGGILLSGIVMIVRVVAIASSLNPDLLFPLLWPLGAAAALMALVATGIFIFHQDEEEGPAILIKTPFDLATALKFAGMIALISLAAKWLIAAIGENALIWLAALSGIADVDAITLSLADMSRNTIDISTAAAGIAVAVGVNTVVKAGMTFAFGTRRTGWIVAGASLAAAAAGMGIFGLAG